MCGTKSVQHFGFLVSKLLVRANKHRYLSSRKCRKGIECGMSADDSDRRQLFHCEVLAVVGEQVDVDGAATVMLQFEQCLIDFYCAQLLIVGIFNDGGFHAYLYNVVSCFSAVNVLRYQMAYSKPLSVQSNNCVKLLLLYT